VPTDESTEFWENSSVSIESSVDSVDDWLVPVGSVADSTDTLSTSLVSFSSKVSVSCCFVWIFSGIDSGDFVALSVLGDSSSLSCSFSTLLLDIV